jgi:hypothetical protein
MYAGLHTVQEKAPVSKRYPDVTQRVSRRDPRGTQKARYFELETSLRRSLRDGVFSLLTCCAHYCLCRHISIRLQRDASLGSCSILRERA